MYIYIFWYFIWQPQRFVINFFCFYIKPIPLDIIQILTTIFDASLSIIFDAYHWSTIWKQIKFFPKPACKKFLFKQFKNLLMVKSEWKLLVTILLSGKWNIKIIYKFKKVFRLKFQELLMKAILSPFEIYTKFCRKVDKLMEWLLKFLHNQIVLKIKIYLKKNLHERKVSK